jgi:hypothetical protein
MKRLYDGIVTFRQGLGKAESLGAGGRCSFVFGCVGCRDRGLLLVVWLCAVSFEGLVLSGC